MFLKVTKKFIKKFFLTTLLTSFLTIGLPSLSENKTDFNNEISKNLEIDKHKVNPKNSELQNDIYILGPGDRLTIFSPYLDEISGSYQIFNDGAISIPIAGNIFISGLSIEQAIKVIEKELSNQIIEPTITLLIDTPRPINVSIIGEIEQPGVYAISPTSGQKSNIEGTNEKVLGFPRLLNVIQLAGGITQKANIKKVMLKRKLPGKNSGYKFTEIDLFDLIINGDQTQNPYLFDGDIVKLIAAKTSMKDLSTVTYFNVSPKLISVNIMGEVNSPGKYTLKSNIPLSQAIINAGGPKNWRANKGNVDLVRVNRDGSVTLKKYRINLNKGLSDKTNPPLRNNDSILVGRTTFAKTNDAIKSVSEPLSGVVTIWSLFRLIGG